MLEASKTRYLLKCTIKLDSLNWQKDRKRRNEGIVNYIAEKPLLLLRTAHFVYFDCSVPVLYFVK